MKFKLTQTKGYSWGEPDVRLIFSGELTIDQKLTDEKLIDKLNEHSVGSIWWEKTTD